MHGFGTDDSYPEDVYRYGYGHIGPYLHTKHGYGYDDNEYRYNQVYGYGYPRYGHHGLVQHGAQGVHQAPHGEHRVVSHGLPPRVILGPGYVGASHTGLKFVPGYGY